MSETSERFIKFIPSEEAMYLLKNKGHAFRLLAIVAESARRYEGGPDGLKVGECFIGGFQNYDMTEQNYRSAKAILIRRQHLLVIETCRTRQKATTEVTTVSTKVKLLSSNVWDINLILDNDRSNDRPTTDQRPTNDKLRKIKKEKKDKKPTYLPNLPSSGSSVLVDVGRSVGSSEKKEEVRRWLTKGQFKEKGKEPESFTDEEASFLIDTYGVERIEEVKSMMLKKKRETLEEMQTQKGYFKACLFKGYK